MCWAEDLFNYFILFLIFLADLLGAVIHSPAHQNQQETFDARPSRPTKVLSLGSPSCLILGGVDEATIASLLWRGGEKDAPKYTTSWHNHRKKMLGKRGAGDFSGANCQTWGGVTIPQNAILSSKSFKTIMKHHYGKWTSTGIPHKYTL